MDSITKIDFPFFQAPNDIFNKDLIVIDEGEERKMKGNEKLVLLYLFRCVNNGKVAFPSYQTIAECCGINKRTAIKCIKVLVDSCYIIKKNRGKFEGLQSSKNYSNVYNVVFEKFKKV